jgi:hypothetical protein
MGTFLKIVGVFALIWFGLAAVGCAIIMKAVSGPAGQGFSAAVHHANDRDAVVSALQDGRIDVERLPADMETAPEVTLTLRDGSTRVLGTSSADRLVRAMLAAKIRAESSRSGFGATPYYERANQPHFKPGEPMVNPNPGSHYDDQ